MGLRCGCTECEEGPRRAKAHACGPCRATNRWARIGRCGWAQPIAANSGPDLQPAAGQTISSTISGIYVSGRNGVTVACAADRDGQGLAPQECVRDGSGCIGRCGRTGFVDQGGAHGLFGRVFDEAPLETRAHRTTRRTEGGGAPYAAAAHHTGEAPSPQQPASRPSFYTTAEKGGYRKPGLDSAADQLAADAHAVERAASWLATGATGLARGLAGHRPCGATLPAQAGWLRGTTLQESRPRYARLARSDGAV